MLAKAIAEEGEFAELRENVDGRRIYFPLGDGEEKFENEELLGTHTVGTPKKKRNLLKIRTKSKRIQSVDSVLEGLADLEV